MLLSAGLLTAVFFAPACSSADDVQLAADRCVEVQTIYAPPVSIGGAGSLQTVRRAGQCSPAVEQLGRALDGETEDRSRLEWALAIARSIPPVAVSLILDDAIEPTIELRVPAGYIDPFIPRLFEGIEDGEYSARGIRLYFLKQGDELRPWSDVVGEFVDRDAVFSILAVPDDHLSIMRRLYDSDLDQSAMFIRMGIIENELELAKYGGDESQELGVYLPVADATPWFMIDCSVFGGILPSDGIPNGYCGMFLFAAENVMIHGSIPYRDMANWRIYRDGYRHTFNQLATGE